MRPELDRILWWDTLPTHLRQPLGQPLQGPLTVDVAITGAGFTGLWTAYYLQGLLPGCRIAIIEANVAGFGASGRNGGWASSYFPQDDLAVTRRVGIDQARLLRQYMNDAVDEVKREATAHNWEIDWAKGGTVIAARSPAQWEAMQHRHEAERQAGLDPTMQLLDAEQTTSRVRATRVMGGSFSEHCAAVNPAKLVRNLAAHVVAQGALLIEGTPALSLQPGVVHTAHGQVRARHVLRCTEGYTPSLTGMRRTLLPVYSLMVATEPLPDRAWSEIGLEGRPTFSDGRHLVIYGQRTADGRLAFGGRGAPYRFGSRVDSRSELNSRTHENLRQVLTDMFPVLREFRFTHAWGGALGIARDWWASVGVDQETGLGWCGGYVGDGVVTSNLGGRTLASLVAGRTNDDLLTLPWVNHRSRKWEIEPLRWAGTRLGLAAVTAADTLEARGRRPSTLTRLMSRFVGH